ncbi:MAG: TraB/GumN family protein [Bacteroidota bacterium]
MIRAHFLFILALVFSQGLQAQNKAVENSLFWEVSGNGLAEPSYLFGTFHLLDNRFVDSLTNVVSKFQHSNTVVTEMLMDSSMYIKMMLAAQMKNASLDKLLSPEDYQQTAAWLKELAGYDLKMFNGFNPITIQVLLISSLQQKYYPVNATLVMDLYFQQMAKKANKKSIGLETFEEQIHAIYGQFTYERQAELLMKFVRGKDKAFDDIVKMNKLYRQGNLTELEGLMSDQEYDQKEREVLLDTRNKQWISTLPELMHAQSTFVAVGALHLAGNNGLVNLMRKLGYTVKPLRLKLN